MPDPTKQTLELIRRHVERTLELRRYVMGSIDPLPRAAGKALAAALDKALTQALEEGHKEGAKAGWFGRPPLTLCLQCGPEVAMDEDSCCATCGAPVTGPWLDRVRVLAEEVEHV